MNIEYAKSKVYLHPTKSNKDNVPGYLILSRPLGPATDKDVLMRFVPESSISTKDKTIYQEIDLEIDDKPGRRKRTVSAPEPDSYGFVVAIALIYLIQVRKPSPGWWYGSLIVHLKTGKQMPVLFFHDDELPLTVAKQQLMNRNFDTFSKDGLVHWGGADFLDRLGKLIKTERLTVEPSVVLVDPLSADLTNFAPLSEPKPAQPKKPAFPDVNKMLANAKWKVLETVALFGQKTRNQMADLVEDHVPSAVLQLVMRQPEVQRILTEFDSARVYLARWAAQVKEEAELLQRKYMLDDAVYTRINRELGAEVLTPEEVGQVSRRKPVSAVEWRGFFDHSGSLLVTVSEVKQRVFHGGIEPEARPEAWLFLLGVYPWESTDSERKTLRESLVTGYADFKRRWIEDEQKRGTDFWKDQKTRIEKDVHRNDRHLAIFQKSAEEEAASDDDDQWDLAIISNRHLFALREILLTFNEYNDRLGYVQGMTDLLLPIYVILQDETLSFWAFAKFMDRMERNFVRDQSGMKRQMETLNALVQFMLPDLYKHLEKCELTDLFFFFRALLVWYKREFPWDDVLVLWEALFTDLYSSQFHLFVALAILSDNERIIKQNLRHFDEVLKYMNDLSGHMKLDHVLMRAELLFLRFKRMIDLIDKENLLRLLRGELYEAHVNPDLRKLLSKELVMQKETVRPEGAGGG